MSTVKLAHISDLHCDSSSGWNTAFQRVCDCLLEELPNVIVITGDCVDHPIDDHFKTLAAALQGLCNDIKMKRPDDKLFMLSIPGNHDRNFFGNKLPLPGWRSNMFDGYQAGLLFAYDQTDVPDWNTLTGIIFKDLAIAFFPFDSNPPARISFEFARGRVEDPHGTFRRYDTQFREIADESGIPYSSCPKIALLHHHPFPLPTNRSDERLEPFNIMVNAHEFLSAAAFFDIDIILHGHRHVSGLLEVTLPTARRVSMHICACASSCRPGEGRHELHIIESKDNGTCIVRTYESDDKNPVFRPRSDKDLIPYGRKRKKRYRDHDVRPVPGDSPVAEVKTKTKVVNILPDGKALVRISLDNIKWLPNTRGDQMHVKFRVKSDVGRIVEGWGRLSDNRSGRKLQDVRRSDLTTMHNDPERTLLSDDYVFKVSPAQTSPSPDMEAFCTLRYPILNAYVLDETQHEEAYAGWPMHNIHREETCSIRGDYPTGLLRLIIRFPSNDAFPEVDSIYVDAHKESYASPGEEALQEPDVLTREYFTSYKEFFDERETAFLANVDALSVCPEINLIALFVRYPQPNVIYTVRWMVPDNPGSTKFSPSEMRKLAALRTAFIDADDPGVRAFYGRLCLLLQQLPGWEGLSCYLLGYDNERKYLQVVHGPNTPRAGWNWKVRVGRGASGKAFKMLQPEYYEKGQIALWPIFERQEGTYFVEPLHDDFDPEVLLALPLMYPDLLKESDSGERYGRGFAVITIAAERNDSPLLKFNPSRSIRDGGLDPQERQAHIDELYAIVHNALKEYVGDIYSV